MAQKTRAYLKSKFKTGDKPTQDDFYDWMDSFALNPQNAAYSTSIPFNSPLTTIETKTLTGNIVLTPLLSNAVSGHGAIMRIVGDGVSTVNLSAFKVMNGAIDNASGAVNFLAFLYDGVDYQVYIRPVPGFVVQLATPTLTANTISDTEIELTWTNVANEIGYELQRKTGGGIFVTFATPAANTTTLVNGGLMASTLFDYRICAIGNGTTFSNSNYSAVASDTTDAAPVVPLPLTFTTRVNVGPYNTTDFLSTSASSPGTRDAYALDAKYLAAGNDGWIQCRWENNIQYNGVLGFNTSNINEGDANYETAFLFSSLGDIYDMTNGVVGSPRASLVAGNYYRLERTGSTIKLRTSANGTTGFTDLHTFSFTSSANLYVNMAIGGGQTVVSATGFNLT